MKSVWDELRAVVAGGLGGMVQAADERASWFFKLLDEGSRRR